MSKRRSPATRENKAKLKNLQARFLHLAISQHIRVFRKTCGGAGTCRFRYRQQGNRRNSNFVHSPHQLAQLLWTGYIASLKEQTDVRHKHDYFACTSPEVLQHFKLRWDDMIKEAVWVGIDKELSDKSRFYHFCFALVKYAHSDLVNKERMLKEPPISMSTRSTTSRIIIRNVFASHESTPTRPHTGTPNLREPDTHRTRSHHWTTTKEPRTRRKRVRLRRLVCRLRKKHKRLERIIRKR